MSVNFTIFGRHDIILVYPTQSCPSRARRILFTCRQFSGNFLPLLKMDESLSDSRRSSFFMPYVLLNTHTHSHSLSLAYTHIDSHIHKHTLSHSCIHAHTFKLTHTHSLSFFHTRTHTHTHTLSFFHTRTHKQTHSHTHTLYLSFFHTPSNMSSWLFNFKWKWQTSERNIGLKNWHEFVFCYILTF